MRGRGEMAPGEKTALHSIFLAYGPIRARVAVGVAHRLATSRRPRGENSECSTTRKNWKTSPRFPGTGSRLWPGIERVGTASGSTSSGESVSSGEMEQLRTLRLSTITGEVTTGVANKGQLPPIHPGEILREEFLAPSACRPMSWLWPFAYRLPASTTSSTRSAA
jgi:hypothetical protein